MQLNTLLFAGMLTLTTNAAESSSQAVKETKSTPAAPTTTVASLTPEQSAITACLDACKAGDVDCQSKCIAVPSPNTQQVNATNNCVAACPVGKGTAADNKAYQDCFNDCIGKYYYTSTGTPALSTKPAKVDSSGTPSATDVDIVTTVTSGDATFTTTFHSKAAQNTDTPTDSADAASATHKNAAQAMNKLAPVGSGIRLLGFLAAFFAL
ncbi:hypothetical protein PG993_006553 [Apiospora rasikravindrae]|uniref:Uncharacterized protein n=1 Tax=Apiospora rasikravindrae TaxID=990691 RepID=A0ABR1T607_9PEZI